LRSGIDYVLFDEYWKFDGKDLSSYNADLWQILQTEYRVTERGPDGILIFTKTGHTSVP